MKTLIIFQVFLISIISIGQEKPIKVIEEKSKNRLMLYALNETDKDYDVVMAVKGTNFRQSMAKPRLTRVPATSKVLMKTLILLRDKTPSYSIDLSINDSLSKRAVRKEYTVVEVPPKMITPKKHITIYGMKECLACDSIVIRLSENNYIFKQFNLEEKPEIKQQLEVALGNKSLDSLKTPIVNLGGHLYTWISSFEQLLGELQKE
ncbi:hypothetical protein [Croceitalea rosinachiae]|uniref:Glutaredoxin n=1 Tax=Croceitalea rosinachiae TaxID=3075596 RepID=A0ABU3AFE2_9FLAO|nr:hypothetical protein [Croceitalea sp. F388]MDT0607576.1 hypothetical protein [Croceitalea sp. F388]